MKKFIARIIILSVVLIGLAAYTTVAFLQTNQMSMSNTDAQTTTIGNMSREEFDRQNAQGAAAVAAVTASSTAMSKSDQKLMNEVAMGGMMQLEVSRVAVQKATNEEARILAQSEVDEQTALSAKLQEIATAKGMTMPTSSDSKTASMVNKMQNMSGMSFDQYYVKESGVKGHEKLDSVMSKVESKATDDSLKSLASAAHPLVRTHLQVSRDVLAKMTGNMSNGNSAGGRSNNGSDNSSNSNSNENGNSGNSNNRNSNMNSNGNSNNRNMNSNGNSNNRNMNSNNSNMNSNGNSNNRNMNSNGNSNNRNMNSNGNSNNRNMNSNGNSNGNSNSNSNMNSNRNPNNSNMNSNINR